MGCSPPWNKHCHSDQVIKTPSAHSKTERQEQTIQQEANRG